VVVAVAVVVVIELTGVALGRTHLLPVARSLRFLQRRRRRWRRRRQHHRRRGATGNSSTLKWSPLYFSP